MLINDECDKFHISCAVNDLGLPDYFLRAFFLTVQLKLIVLYQNEK